MRSYYLASLLPTSIIDAFFSFRQRLLTRVAGSAHQDGSIKDAPNENRSERRPLPFPGQSSSERKQATGTGNDESYVVDTEETILPPYAPFAEGSSMHSSASQSQAQSPMDPHSSVYSETSRPSSAMNSTFMDESYIRV